MPGLSEYIQRKIDLRQVATQIPLDITLFVQSKIASDTTLFVQKLLRDPNRTILPQIIYQPSPALSKPFYLPSPNKKAKRKHRSTAVVPLRSPAPPPMDIDKKSNNYVVTLSLPSLEPF
eukprot:123952_1